MEIAKTKSLWDKTKLEAGLNASLELQCRETMKLEQNTSGQASRQASSQASRASRLWKLEQNNMTKKGNLFWSSKHNKKQARKNGPPQ